MPREGLGSQEEGVDRETQEAEKGNGNQAQVFLFLPNRRNKLYNRMSSKDREIKS